MPAFPPSTKEQIVLAGERLFAQHGIDGISLRQIATAAGAGSNSAVQYHFGTKEQLIQAIFENRLPDLHHRRSVLMASTGAGTLRDLMNCQVLPVMEQAERPGSHYLGFVAMLRQYQHYDVIKRIPAEFMRPVEALSQRASAHLGHLPPGLARLRLLRAMGLLLQAAADREQANAEGRPTMSFRLDVSDLLDCIVAILQAPASPGAIAAIEDSHGAGLP